MEPPRIGALAGDKAAWRAWARTARQVAAADASLAAAVNRHLLGWGRYRSAGTVAVYLAFGSEVDLRPLIADAVSAGKVVAAPRVIGRGAMRLRRLEQESPTEQHAFGQSEPPEDAPVVEPEAVDVWLVPGLAFDRGGGRLGFGAGYYDRLLAASRASAARVGVTAQAMVVARLPAEEHDVLMTHLATEGGVAPASGHVSAVSGA